MGWIAFSWAGEPLHLLGWIAFFWAGQPLEAMDWIACEWMPCCPGSRTSPPEWDCTRLLSEPWRKVARAMWVTGMARASQSTASNMVVAVLCGDKTYGLCMRCTTLTWPCPSSWSTSRTMPRSCVGCRRATWKATGSTWAECTRLRWLLRKSARSASSKRCSNGTCPQVPPTISTNRLMAFSSLRMTSLRTNCNFWNAVPLHPNTSLVASSSSLFLGQASISISTFCVHVSTESEAGSKVGTSIANCVVTGVDASPVEEVPAEGSIPDGNCSH